MAAVTTREQLKQYCLRELGAPLVNIDVSEEQLQDRIDSAILYFQEYYWEGIVKVYLKFQISAQNIADKFIQMPDNVWSVTRIFPASTSITNQLNIFDLQYQLRMNDLRDLTSTSMIYYTQVMQHLDLLDQLLRVEHQIRFNRLEGNLYIDMNWNTSVGENNWLIAEAYAALDPASSPKMWNDRHFKEYVVASFKKQWGTNLKKYKGISLVGGVQLDGQALYEEGSSEMKAIETEIMDNLSPLEFFTG